MKKARNILRAILFIFGITLQFTSFGVSQVEQAPWVLNIVSPKCVRGMAGVRKIEAGKSLDPNDEGFQEINKIVKMQLRERNPSKVEVVNRLDIEKLKPEGESKADFFGILSVHKVDVCCLLSNGQEGVVTNTDSLRRQFEETRNALFFAGLWVCLLLVR